MKRINTGYMSGYFSQGCLHTREMNPQTSHERQRSVDADANVCLTCRRPAERCTGKCKQAKGGKEKR